MYEANQINGVYFAGPAKTEGYIDDFGCWQTYTWTDYFERIFNLIKITCFLDYDNMYYILAKIKKIAKV